MRILHTADLHLGKKLGKASRLDEQRLVLKELAELADRENIDVILIAGDIFDAPVPPSDAERVFYRGMLTLAERGRAVVALAGNHDDEKRMCAAKPLADTQGIVLAGELDYSSVGEGTFSDPTPPPTLYALSDAADYMQKQRIRLTGHFGGITVEKDGEKVNIALVPYPSEGRLSRWFEQDYNIPYAERVKLAIEKACEFFDDSYNILCTHLFLTKTEGAEALGGLAALPVSVLPQNADYVALGHVHKHLRVSKLPLADYSGAPLMYAYDDTRNKSVNIIDTQKRTVEQAMLYSGKRLTEKEADNFEECLARLEDFKNDYVRLLYGGDPLGKEETASLRAHPAFNDLIVTAAARRPVEVERRAHLSDGEIFTMYYKYKTGRDVPDSIKTAFVGLMEELRNETR